MADSQVTDPRIGEPRRAVVAQLFDSYGFLLTPDCREVRFAREAVLRDEFDELRVGSEGDLRGEQRRRRRKCRPAVDLQSIPYPRPEEAEEPLAESDEVPDMPEDDIWQEK